MMSKMVRVGLALTLVALLTQVRTAAQSPQKPHIEVRLSVLTTELHNNGEVRVRIEIENIGDETVLIGRDISGVHNWPFRIEIGLEDTKGNKYGLGGTAFLDGTPEADFSAKDNVLRWWTPLAPHTFIGTYINGKVAGVPPGNYKIRGKYVSLLSPSRKKTQEESQIRAKFSIFEGQLETNTVDVQVLSGP